MLHVLAGVLHLETFWSNLTIEPQALSYDKYSSCLIFLEEL